MIKVVQVKEERTEKRWDSGTVCSACLPFTLILCSPLGCGKMSTHMTTSPTASTPDAVEKHKLLFVRVCVACVFCSPQSSRVEICSYKNCNVSADCELNLNVETT